MAQSDRLTDALKKLLKARGITYAELGRRVRLSEPSVKRLFSTGRFTLHRLEAICDAIETDFLELARLAHADKTEARELTQAQEEALARDPELVAIAYLLLNGWSPSRIRSTYEIGEATLTRHLAALDRLRIIDYAPGDRVRLRVTRNLRWRSDGPLARKFKQQLLTDFFATTFTGPLHRIRFMTGDISAASSAIVQRKLEQLAAEFNELVTLDAAAGADRRHTALVLATRPWSFSVVNTLKRRDAPVRG